MAVDLSVRVRFLKMSGGQVGRLILSIRIFSIITYHQGQNKVKYLRPESGRAGGPTHIFQQPVC